MKILVLTISDRATEGVYEDRSGPAVEKVLLATDIEEALGKDAEHDVILTTGGSGIGPRDNAPDVTMSFCDRSIPGIAEYLRSESCKETLNAVLSRGIAGYKGTTIIINLPGSVKGAVFCAELLVPILPHACDMILGKGH